MKDGIERFSRFQDANSDMASLRIMAPMMSSGDRRRCLHNFSIQQQTSLSSAAKISFSGIFT